jgi:hypothetical protein
MLNRRVPVHGVLAVLLALMAQLGISATVPRLNPLAQIIRAEMLCHPPDGVGDTPAPAPMHPLDCLVCPLCVALQAPPIILVGDGEVTSPSAAVVVLRPELPPLSAEPPSSQRPPSQPRAPPAVS